MKTKLLIASHKEYYFPEDKMYTPIHVGAQLSENNFGYMSDDTDDNISDKNRTFCELTALYWVWKNNFFEDDEFFGLVHYRRYFLGSMRFRKFNILSQSDITKIMQTHDIIVPKKREYYIENIRSHYNNAHHKKDLDAVEQVISELTPAYNNAFNKVMNDTGMHLYNMFIMSKKDYNNFCTWLFSVLFELEKRIDISGYSTHQSRVFGFLSELLFNVWLQEQNLRVKEVSVVNLEGENKILKAINLIKRKFYKDMDRK